jgi:hypothetical protein
MIDFGELCHTYRVWSISDQMVRISRPQIAGHLLDENPFGIYKEKPAKSRFLWIFFIDRPGMSIQLVTCSVIYRALFPLQLY